jgi:hypothetical protein
MSCSSLSEVYTWKATYTMTLPTSLSTPLVRASASQAVERLVVEDPSLRITCSISDREEGIMTYVEHGTVVGYAGVMLPLSLCTQLPAGGCCVCVVSFTLCSHTSHLEPEVITEGVLPHTRLGAQPQHLSKQPSRMRAVIHKHQSLHHMG